MAGNKNCNSSYQLFYGTCPDMACAKRLARALLDKKLVACVNLVPGICSLYHWQGEVEEDEEVIFLAKASSNSWEEAARLFAKLHPYDEPVFVAYDIANGLPGYLKWIDASLGSLDH